MKAEDFIDYNDKSLFEDHDHIPSSDEKEFYTPEEAYELVMSDKALKGRHDVKQGCNPCATRTILLALLITLFAPAAAWLGATAGDHHQLQQRRCVLHPLERRNGIHRIQCFPSDPQWRIGVA